MKTLSNINPELMDILNGWSEWFDYREYDLPLDERGEQDMEYYCSDEYLEEVMAKGKKHMGPPEYARVCNLHTTAGVPSELRKKSLELSKQLADWLCAKYNAVHVVYPQNGFMSWHNNWDCPGYNILLSRSDGNGFFKHLEDGEITTIDDVSGWQVKVGYYGGKTEDPYWHCAGSRGRRETIGFVIPDKSFWQEMVNDICS